MRSSHSAAGTLADIVENAERIKCYLGSMDRNTFAEDELVRDAVERCRLGDDAAILLPDQPWADIHGMGNRQRHAYDRINIDICGTPCIAISPIWQRTPGRY